MIDREKVIKGLECCATDQCEECPYEDTCFGDNAGDLFETLARDALALLKAQEPRVMTLEELRGMPPVWDSNTPPYVWLDINRDCINTVSHWVAWRDVKELIYGVYPKYNPDEYGEAWRCWTFRPTDAQREAIPWNL